MGHLSIERHQEEKSMKTFVITLLGVCALVITGAIVYQNWQKSPKAPAPVAAPSASQPAESAPAEQSSAPAPSSSPVAAQSSPVPQDTTTSPANVTTAIAADSASPAHKLALALLNAKSALEKQALFEELRTNGNLEAVITDLKQQAQANPSDPEIPTTIGEAEINELRTLAENGGQAANHDQIGILAMQADQEFDTALQIDPKNWEAQFVKYSTMYYWPSNPQTDNQVVQNLSSLIDQQETMSPNPAFAQTYITLGNEYQKIGQPDKAQATWQLGAQEFPNDPTLQKKIANPATQ
jgi:tetratricopeptide (TPR) repeat protein